LFARSAVKQEQEILSSRLVHLEGTPCHGGRFLVANSLLPQHYHPRP
jgi:hypothetical protein